MNKIILEKEEYNFCIANLNTIEQIVRTASCSNITKEYRTGLVSIGQKYKWLTCKVCNSSLYIATTRLYNAYLNTKNNIEALNNTKNGNKRKKKTQ